MSSTDVQIDEPSPESFFNRELSWLRFAERVLAQVSDPQLPLLERLKFAGIVGMLHDEFFMKRISGLKRQTARRAAKVSIDGRTPEEELEACHQELRRQLDELGAAMEELLAGLAEEGLLIHDWKNLSDKQRVHLRKYFRRSVEPILTPLAVDAEHPFPFISNMGLNLAVLLPPNGRGVERFVRIKVPNNRPRWVPLRGEAGVVPLEQVIAANLDLMFPDAPPTATHFFRVTRGAEGERQAEMSSNQVLDEPGSIVQLVSSELKARKFAGVVRLEIDRAMPKKLVKWLVEQLDVQKADVYPATTFMALSSLSQLDIADRNDLHHPAHEAAVHPRLRDMGRSSTSIFRRIERGDILLHHPYHSFDSSVLRFLQSAARDPNVLAIKLTIYRTGTDSPIIRALAEAARRGKQVAVLVEITARFDEAPNIAWGEFLEKEGVHVSYGVEHLKTHVKLALVVREERGVIHRYAHVGTGNYNVRTARIYEDLGLLTCNEQICDDVASVFNALTGAIGKPSHEQLLVAPHNMKQRFVEMIRREADHAREGRPCGIWAKMNQLQSREIIRELYAASRAGVPITLNVRGLSCLRPGVPGMSESIQVFGLVGRFLDHSRIYRFENGGAPEYYIGSADWMKRNLERRVETIVPLFDDASRAQIDRLIEIYDLDNTSVWDCREDGNYERRRPRDGEPPRAAQEMLSQEATGGGDTSSVSLKQVS